jgi:hypothetical protein
MELDLEEEFNEFPEASWQSPDEIGVIGKVFKNNGLYVVRGVIFPGRWSARRPDKGAEGTRPGPNRFFKELNTQRVCASFHDGLWPRYVKTSKEPSAISSQLGWSQVR